MPAKLISTNGNSIIRNPFFTFENILSAQDRFEGRRFMLEHLNAGITHCEFITLTAVYDRTLLYGKLLECIPEKHIMGTALDGYQPTGISYPLCRKSLSKSLLSLMNKGYIIGLYKPDSDRHIRFYGINFLYTVDRSDLAKRFYMEAFNSICCHSLRFRDETMNYLNGSLDPDYYSWLQDCYNKYAIRH